MVIIIFKVSTRHQVFLIDTADYMVALCNTLQDGSNALRIMGTTLSNFERTVTKFAPHKALKLIPRGKLMYDERLCNTLQDGSNALRIMGFNPLSSSSVFSLQVLEGP